MRPDPYCGWSLQPGAVHWDRGAGAFLRINSDGLRDREHARLKPPGTWRLAVLGDSFTQGREARLEEIFPRVLERLLANCPVLAERKPEVINFGVAGYGTAQELLALEHRVWDYDPDAILVAFYGGNDVADNHPLLAIDADIRPFFSLAQDGRLVSDFGFRDSARYRFESTKFGRLKTRLKRNFRLWQVVDRMLLVLRTRWARPGYQLTSDRESGLVPGALVPPQDSRWKEAWHVTDAIFILLNEEVRAHGRQLFVFTVSAPIQVDPDPAERGEEARALGVPDLLYPERHLSDFTARNGITFFALIEPMQRRAEENHVFLHGIEGTGRGFQHWNRRGHALAAELLAGRICEELGRVPQASK
jgi:hypothetical protein